MCMPHSALPSQGVFSLNTFASQVDGKILELQDGLTDMMSQDPPRSVQDLISYVKTKKQEQVKIPTCGDQLRTLGPCNPWLLLVEMCSRG